MTTTRQREADILSTARAHRVHPDGRDAALRRGEGLDRPRPLEDLAAPRPAHHDAHKGIFITSLVLSFVGLVLQCRSPEL